MQISIDANFVFICQQREFILCLFMTYTTLFYDDDQPVWFKIVIYNSFNSVVLADFFFSYFVMK